MRALDLFCGCGGFSCGMRTRFDVVLAADWDEAALRVFRRQHPATPAVHADLSVDMPAVLAQAAADNGADDPANILIFGSPPCQDFSNSGSHREAERAQLAVTFAQAVASARPRLAVMENVPYFLRTQAFRDVCELWTTAGYHVLALLINAAACGVAQDRRRAFVFATTADADVLREAHRHAAATLDTVPADAPTMAECLDSHHLLSPHPAPARTHVWYCARNRWQPCVYAADRPSPTFRCNCLAPKPAHYERRHDDAAGGEQAHVLSVAEAARIASFPSDYFASEGRPTASRLLGNAVPPRMAEVVAELCERLWKLSAAPLSSHAAVVVGAPKPYVGKPGRIEKLLALHAFDAPKKGRFEYVVGTVAAGDDAIAAVLNWRPRPGWRIVLRKRATTTANADDVYIYVPGHATEFRSKAQIVRALGEVV